MSNEFGKRRAQIVAFLKQLSADEKIVVLTYLANDAGISARIPSLAKIALDMRRAQHRAELLTLASDNSNLDLEFLARRKGCRLAPVNGAGDLWRIVPAAWRDARFGLDVSRTQQNSFTRKQALEFLRSLPDEQSNA
jgi:hypothetical protein